MANKIGPAIRRVKNKEVISQRFGCGQTQTTEKPKSFAENLMNMLAMQNIGQVFSENPVGAMSVLKEPNQKPQGKRKNSVIIGK